MSDARADILTRVRTALADVPQAERPEDVTVARGYRRHSQGPHRQRFEERARDYRATVHQITAADLRQAVLEGCRQMGINRAVVPAGFPAQWLPGEVEIVEDDDFDPRELDRFDGVISGCAAAIAETGTLVLDGSGVCGRRAITLIPDRHICIVTEDQIVGLVPEAIARIAPAAEEGRQPITLVSGPSATSDIELTRVEGVHGPRNLLVLIVASRS